MKDYLSYLLLQLFICAQRSQVLMSNQPKPTFTKVKLKPSLSPSNPRLAKELQIEEGLKTKLQTEWDNKVNSLILRKGVKHRLIDHSSIDHHDSF